MRLLARCFGGRIARRGGSCRLAVIRAEDLHAAAQAVDIGSDHVCESSVFIHIVLTIGRQERYEAVIIVLFDSVVATLIALVELGGALRITIEILFLDDLHVEYLLRCAFVIILAYYKQIHIFISCFSSI